MIDRRLLKQQKYCQLARQLYVNSLSLTRSFIICLINKPHLHPVRRLMHMHSLLSCGTWVSALSASRIYLLYSAQRENQLIFIYFNVAPPFLLGVAAVRPSSMPEKFYALLANLLTQFCNKDEIVKIQFQFPLPAPILFLGFSFSLYFFLWPFVETENKVTIVCFFFALFFSPLLGLYACPKLCCKCCYNNSNNKLQSFSLIFILPNMNCEYKLKLYFEDCSTILMKSQGGGCTFLIRPH